MLIFIILCMLISPLMSIPVLCIGLYNNRNKISKWYALPFAFLYGTFGYNLRFIGETDLTRYYMMVDNLKGQKLSHIFSMDKEGLYTRDILFYFVSRTGNNNILAYTVGFGCYFIIFYVYFDMVNRYRSTFRTIRNTHILMMGFLMVSIINPFSVIGNVRCVFSYFLIMFAAYRELVQKKRNLWTILLYIIPIGLHVSTIIILIIRICLPFLQKILKVFIAAALSLPVIIRLTYEIIVKLPFDYSIYIYIKNAVSKAYYYLNWTNGGWADVVEKSISNKIERIYGVFFLCIIICFYYVIKKGKVQVLDQKICDYIYIIATLALGCLSIKTGAFWRFEAVVVMFSSFILLPVAIEKNKYCKNILSLLYLSAGMMQIYNLIRIGRNVVISEFVLGYIGTSTFKVMWEIIRGIMEVV